MTDMTRNAAQRYALLRENKALAPFSHHIERRMRLFADRQPLLERADQAAHAAARNGHVTSRRFLQPQAQRPLLVCDCTGQPPAVPLVPKAVAKGYNALLLGQKPPAAKDRAVVAAAHAAGLAVLWHINLPRQYPYGEEAATCAALERLAGYLLEWDIDGLCFGGIDAMLYHSGSAEQGAGYGGYFSPNTQPDAAVYLMLASALCRRVKPGCVLVAEEYSGMPGIALPIQEGGFGFGYRMAAPLPAQGCSMAVLWQTFATRHPGEAALARYNQSLALDEATHLALFALAGEGYVAAGERPREGTGEDSFTAALLSLEELGAAWRFAPQQMVCDDWYRRLYFRRGSLLFCCNFHEAENAPLPAITVGKAPVLYTGWPGYKGAVCFGKGAALPPGTAAVFAL